VLVPAGQDHAANIRKEVRVTGMEISDSALAMNVGDIKVLDFKVFPATATDRGVRFESSDPKVATVGASGKVTAQRAGTATITAKTTDGGITKTCAVVVATGNIVAPPVASVPSGVYMDAQKVRLSCDTPGKIDIYYTLDGSEPIVGLSNYYTENPPNPKDTSNVGLSISTTPAPIDAGDDMTIKAIAVKDGYIVSDIATFTYGIANKKVAAPTPSIAPGFHTVMRAQGLPIWLWTWTSGAKIYYTVDGTEPDKDSLTSAQFMSSSAIYIGGSATQSITIKARAYKDGMAPSDVVSWTYRVKNATGNAWQNPPISNYYSGVYKAEVFPLSLRFTAPTGLSSPTIRYTTATGTSDAANPSASSTAYSSSSPITMQKNANARAIIVEGNSTQYSISRYRLMSDDYANKCPNPTATPSGRIAKGSAITVTIPASCTVWYMLGGMAPTGGSFMRCVQVGNMMNSTSASNNFRNTIVIDKTTTVRILATRTGYIDSDVVTYTYYVDEDPPPPTKLNFSELVAESRLVIQRRYTLETRRPFASALSAAILVNENVNAAQKQIDDAFAALHLAKEALVPVDSDYVFESEIVEGKYVSYLENLTAFNVAGIFVLAV
jgi:hypothetical protein